MLLWCCCAIRAVCRKLFIQIQILKVRNINNLTSVFRLFPLLLQLGSYSPLPRSPSLFSIFQYGFYYQCDHTFGFAASLLAFIVIVIFVVVSLVLLRKFCLKPTYALNTGFQYNYAIAFLSQLLLVVACSSSSTLDKIAHVSIQQHGEKKHK